MQKIKVLLFMVLIILAGCGDSLFAGIITEGSMVSVTVSSCYPAGKIFRNHCHSGFSWGFESSRVFEDTDYDYLSALLVGYEQNYFREESGYKRLKLQTVLLGIRVLTVSNAPRCLFDMGLAFLHANKSYENLVVRTTFSPTTGRPVSEEIIKDERTEPDDVGAFLNFGIGYQNVDFHLRYIFGGISHPYLSAGIGFTFIFE